MAKEFKLPELGENIESADVIKVLVKAGDQIEKEQSIIEIETDKATIEVPSNVSGKISEVLVKEGESVKFGQPKIKIEDGEGESDKKEKQSEAKAEEKKKEDKSEEQEKEEKVEKKESKEKPETKGETVEFKVPDLGENIDSADVINVLVKKGDTISKDQGVIEIETNRRSTFREKENFKTKRTSAGRKRREKRKTFRKRKRGSRRG
ncbi:MAG: hypothetical protein P8X47_06210 [Ignavibacteriaceae bacterium]